MRETYCFADRYASSFSDELFPAFSSITRFEKKHEYTLHNVSMPISNPEVEAGDKTDGMEDKRHALKRRNVVRQGRHIEIQDLPWPIASGKVTAGACGV